MARILYVATSTTIGGAEKTLHTLVTGLDASRHQTVGIVSLKPEGDYARRLRERGHRVQSLELAGAPRPSDAARLQAIIAETKPDIVHALMYSAIQLCRWTKRSSPHSFHLISSPRVTYRTRSLWTRWVDRFLKRYDDVLIAESDASRDELTRRNGYARDKVRVIRNGIELPGLFRSNEDRQTRRLKMGMRFDETLIAAVGRLDHQKGFDILIEAMSLLKDAPVRCLIIGEGPERENLELQIRRDGLDSSVRLLGEVADVPAWLCASDVFCLPSRWEGLPNALLEAMSLELPAVAARVDGVPEAVADGETGVLVPPENAHALAAALSSLAQSDSQRRAFGAAARARVAERFTLKRMLSEYQDVYSALG